MPRAAEDRKEFGDIVLKSGTDGEIVRLADVARLELGAGDALRSQLDNKNAVGIGIFQSPGANALEIRDQVIATMDEMQKTMPADVKYESVYDPPSSCATRSRPWSPRCWKPSPWWCWW
jgi:multidrug efflux pump